MLRNETCGQPAMGRVVDLLHAALAEPRYDALDAAVAYATPTGVGALREGHAADLDRVSGRWLSSFDWCRSDPVALGALDQLKRSAVRIFDGRYVIGRQGCVPKLPFHPKGFLFSGPNVRLLISGSGNLSRNGLTRGIELDTLIEVHDPTTSEEVAAWKAVEVIRTWFDGVWSSADPYGGLSDPYRIAYARASASPPPRDDDWSDSHLIGSAQKYSAQELIKIRRAPVFWIEVGNLTRNLGPGNADSPTPPSMPAAASSKPTTPAPRTSARTGSPPTSTPGSPNSSTPNTSRRPSPN
jgi:HKD family nuclease